MRVIEAQYENGILRPAERLALRQGELVNLVLVRHPDANRWDLSRLAETATEEDLDLAEQGIAEWADELAESELR